MDFETYWNTLSESLENIKNTPSFVLTKMVAEKVWEAAKKKEEIAAVDHVYLVKAFWPTANAVLIWRESMFESEREAVENFENYARSFSEEERPILLEVVHVTITS